MTTFFHVNRHTRTAEPCEDTYSCEFAHSLDHLTSLEAAENLLEEMRVKRQKLSQIQESDTVALRNPAGKIIVSTVGFTGYNYLIAVQDMNASTNDLHELVENQGWEILEHTPNKEARDLRRAKEEETAQQISQQITPASDYGY